MEVIVANKDDYIRFNAKLLDNMQTFELTEDSTDYIIHRVKLGDEVHDVSLMNTCINNLLDEQYGKREYIKLKEIQAINEIVSNLNQEECHILNAYAEVNRYKVKDLNEIKEVITNMNEYQIIERYDLNELGMLIAEKVSGYKMDTNVVPFVNFVDLAETYLFDAKIKADICSYGFLVNTKGMLANELIEPNTKNDKVLKIEVVNKKEFEESSKCSKVTIQLPATKEVLEEKFKMINLDYNKLTIQDTHVTKCEIINFDDTELSKRFNQRLEYEIEKSSQNSYTVPFQEIELLCKEVSNFDKAKMQKFLALEEVNDHKIMNVHDVINYAIKIDKYELLPNINSSYDMGKYLVNEDPYFNDIGILNDYIDYSQLAEDYTQKGYKYNGMFSTYGYVMEKEDCSRNQEREEEEFE